MYGCSMLGRDGLHKRLVDTTGPGSMEPGKSLHLPQTWTVSLPVAYNLGLFIVRLAPVPMCPIRIFRSLRRRSASVNAQSSRS